MSIDETLALIPEIIERQDRIQASLDRLHRNQTVPRLLVDDEVMEILRIQKSTLYKLVSKGELTVVKAGGNKFDPEDVAAYIQRSKKGGRKE